MKALLSTLLTLSVLSLIALGMYLADHWHPIYGVFALLPLYLSALAALSRSSYLFILYLSKQKEYKTNYNNLGYYEAEEKKRQFESYLLNCIFYACCATILMIFSIHGLTYTIHFFS